MERAMPRGTPNRAPWVTITTLEGTGSTTSTTRSVTPSMAATAPVRPPSGVGSVTNGTWKASLSKNSSSIAIRRPPQRRVPLHEAGHPTRQHESPSMPGMFVLPQRAELGSPPSPLQPADEPPNTISPACIRRRVDRSFLGEACPTATDGRPGHRRVRPEREGCKASGVHLIATSSGRGGSPAGPV